mmetsp:Transcript_35241/g.78426  ORF Transcript_35241/g.78426 Transcript_35241/m.78426 type:complete len:441 (-) Transcript_35241:3580-4902(-)
MGSYARSAACICTMLVPFQPPGRMLSVMQPHMSCAASASLTKPLGAMAENMLPSLASCPDESRLAGGCRSTGTGGGSSGAPGTSTAPWSTTRPSSSSLRSCGRGRPDIAASLTTFSRAATALHSAWYLARTHSPRRACVSCAADATASSPTAARSASSSARACRMSTSLFTASWSSCWMAAVILGSTLGVLSSSPPLPLPLAPLDGVVGFLPAFLGSSAAGFRLAATLAAVASTTLRAVARPAALGASAVTGAGNCMAVLDFSSSLSLSSGGTPGAVRSGATRGSSSGAASSPGAGALSWPYRALTYPRAKLTEEANLSSSTCARPVKYCASSAEWSATNESAATRALSASASSIFLSHRAHSCSRSSSARSTSSPCVSFSLRASTSTALKPCWNLLTSAGRVSLRSSSALNFRRTSSKCDVHSPCSSVMFARPRVSPSR